MTRVAAFRLNVYWNFANITAPTVERMLKKAGITIIERGVQPDGAIGEKRNPFVVRATRKKINALLRSNPSWMTRGRSNLLLVT